MNTISTEDALCVADRKLTISIACRNPHIIKSGRPDSMTSWN